jgi:hypothetical protein
VRHVTYRDGETPYDETTPNRLEAAMDAHGCFFAALLALTAVVEAGQHSARTDRLVQQLPSPQQWMVLPVCSGVELTVACMPLTDIPAVRDTPPQ